MSTDDSTDSGGRPFVAAIAVVAAHAVTIIVAWAAAWTLHDSTLSGIEMAGAAIVVFGGAQLLLFLGILIGATARLVQRRRAEAAGIAIGWVLGSCGVYLAGYGSDLLARLS